MTLGSILSQRRKYPIHSDTRISHLIPSNGASSAVQFMTLTNYLSYLLLISAFNFEAIPDFSIAYTREAPADEAKKLKTPVPAPTSITIFPAVTY